jgi:DnaJ-domain-containing protein 1
MGIGRRLLDLARANLNALLTRGEGDAPVHELSDAELEEELERRKQKRLRADEERRKREAREREARLQAEARAVARGARTRKTPPRAGSPPPPPPRPPRRIAELYAVLQLPDGASFEEVKRAFRRLMREYHPDLHADDPTRQKAATQTAMALTQAYQELERLLTG